MPPACTLPCTSSQMPLHAATSLQLPPVRSYSTVATSCTLLFHCSCPTAACLHCSYHHLLSVVYLHCAAANHTPLKNPPSVLPPPPLRSNHNHSTCAVALNSLQLPPVPLPQSNVAATIAAAPSAALLRCCAICSPAAHRCCSTYTPAAHPHRALLLHVQITTAAIPL